MAQRFVPFRPALEGLLAFRFYRQMRASIKSGTAGDWKQFSRIADDEVAWSISEGEVNPEQHTVFRGCWLLLRDLQRIGWQLRWRSNTVFLGKPETATKPTSPEEIAAQKRAIQNAMSFARLDRLEQYADFIRRMLAPTTNGLAKHSVADLIGNGEEIAHDLRKAARARSTQRRMEILRSSIHPYLQLVSGNERCKFTGHRLADIWRFFRFTWSNPPESTPGRTLLYLVRDAARPYHPVMGIFSLENAPLRISCRDHRLGWTPESFVRELQDIRGSKRALRCRFEFLLNSLDRGIDDIDFSDLCHPKDVLEPTQDVIRQLAEIARKSDDERMLAIKDWQDRSDDAEDAIQSDLGNISLIAEKALYRRKRAERLSRLLAAKSRLRRFIELRTFTNEIDRFVESEAGLTSIRTALIANKNKHVGTSILELNVCGAIPPYNELLAGKLAALLAISPTVIADYRERYGDRPSDIASRMKGSAVVRPAELVFVGTSSLYAGGTSQYNRLRTPKEVFGSPEQVAWERLGATAGYGTLHISRQTLAALEDVLVVQGKVSRSNHVFGEGASPKLRAVRAGIEAILLPRQRPTADAIGRHEMRRLVYGVQIASNAKQVLSNVGCPPRYYFGRLRDHDAATRRVIDFWIERWLASRVQFRPALDRVEAFDADDWLDRYCLLDVERPENTPQTMVKTT